MNRGYKNKQRFICGAISRLTCFDICRGQLPRCSKMDSDEFTLFKRKLWIRIKTFWKLTLIENKYKYLQNGMSCHSWQFWHYHKPPAGGWLQWFDPPVTPSFRKQVRKRINRLTMFYSSIQGFSLTEHLPAFFQKFQLSFLQPLRLSQSTGWHVWCWRSFLHRILRLEHKNISVSITAILL